MGYQTLKRRRDGRDVVHLTLNRPDKRNAISARMQDELTDFAHTIDSDTRAVVLSGAGDIFCTGGDLDWMREQIKADRATRIVEARRLADMLAALNAMPVPLIARVQGAAYGGGVGLICVCDVVIAASDAEFGLTETRLGLIPATVAPYVVARMGEGNARRVMLSARLFGADEARAHGIVSRVVGPDALDEAVEAEVKACLTVAPGAVGATKALIRSLGPVIDDAVITATIERLADTWEGEEATAGIDAFFTKTPPPWK